LTFNNNLKAQIYLSPKYSAPTGYLKDYLNSGFGIELGTASKYYFGVRFRNFVNVEILNNSDAKFFERINPPGNYLVSETTGTRNYIYVGIGAGLDFNPITFKKFNVYYGLDCLFGLNSSMMDYNYYYDDGSDYTSNEYFTSFNAGVRPRVGIEFPLKFGNVGLEFTRSYVYGINYQMAIEETGKIYDFHGRYSLGAFIKF
jgi:hypothetical protein